jgi:hypothetical protein
MGLASQPHAWCNQAPNDRAAQPTKGATWNMSTTLIFADKATGLPKLTLEQQLELEPLWCEYQRALTALTAAQRAYAEAYGAYVVATRKLTGEI